jgi:hypothetical protein
MKNKLKEVSYLGNKIWDIIVKDARPQSWNYLWDEVWFDIWLNLPHNLKFEVKEEIVLGIKKQIYE